MGTLEANNQGNSSVNAVNADGTVITGMSDSHKSRNLDALNRATVWLSNNHNTKLELPHAVSTGSKYYLLDTPVDVKAQTSFLSAVSHDGKVIAGNNPISKNGIVYPIIGSRPVVWAGDNFGIMTELPLPQGSLDSVFASTHAISGDGKAVGGRGTTNIQDDTNKQYFPLLWSGANHQTLTRLSTPDHTTYSTISALNKDGSIAIGYLNPFENSLINDKAMAFAWHGNNWQVRTNLTALDGSNSALANDISDDGKVIVGYSNKSLGNPNGTVWTGDNWQEKHEIDGILVNISGNGKVIGGDKLTFDNNGNGDLQATVWHGKDWSEVVSLGTHRSDNWGLSSVRALNQDGTIAVGMSESDEVVGAYNDNALKATLWKINYTNTNQPNPTPTPPTNPPVVTPPVNPPTAPTPPVNPPVVTPPTPTPVVVAKIDVANTAQTVNRLGQDSFTLMCMQSHALVRLQYSCVNYDGVCFGVQQDVSLAKDKEGNKHRDVAMGVNIGYGFGNGISAGISLDHLINRKLPDSYRHSDDNVGVGAVMRYHSPKGYFGEISGAYDKYAVTITRPTLANTEIGVNDADIKGTAYGLKVGKNFGNQNKHRAYVGVKHRDISRGAYTENEQTDFPISYGEMSYKNTALTVGASTNVALTNKLSWVSDVQVERRLSGDDPVYTASLTGVEKYEFSHTNTPAKTQGYVATGISYKVVPQTRIEVMPYVNKNANGEHGGGAVFRIETAF